MSIKTSTQYVCLVITLPLRAGIKHNCDPDWTNSHQGSDWPWLHNVSAYKMAFPQISRHTYDVKTEMEK